MKIGVIFILCLLSGSAYSMSTSIVVNAPLAQVWDYLGQSGHATQWSVFFDHISPLSGHDGTQGSQRRCFRNQDEKGSFWDETVVTNQFHQKRVLAVGNLHGFFPASADNLHFLTAQSYEALSPFQTRLTFSAQVDGPVSLPEKSFMAVSIPLTKKIFKENLVNIKAVVEEKENFIRIFPWESDVGILFSSTDASPHCLQGDATHENLFISYNEKEKYERVITGFTSPLPCATFSNDFARMGKRLPLTGKGSILNSLDLTHGQRKYLEQIRLGASELRSETTATEFLGRHPIAAYTKDLNREFTQKYGEGFAGDIFRAWIESQPKNIFARDLLMSNMELFASPKSKQEARETSERLAALFNHSIILVSLGFGWDNDIQPNTPWYVKAFLNHVQGLGLPVEVLRRNPFGTVEENAAEILPQVAAAFKQYQHVYFLATCKGSAEALLAFTRLLESDGLHGVIKSKFSGVLNLSGQIGPVYLADALKSVTHSKILDRLPNKDLPKSWQVYASTRHALSDMDTASMARITNYFLPRLPDDAPYLNVVGILSGNGLLKLDATAMAPFINANRNYHLAKGANDGFLEYPDNTIPDSNLQRNYVIAAESSHMLVEGRMGPYSLLEEKNEIAVFKALLKTLAELKK